MGWSAIIPVEDAPDANASLEAAGYGPENFSVPCGDDGGLPTHLGFHCWDMPAFRLAVSALPGVTISDGQIAPVQQFTGLVLDHIGIPWPPPESWMEALPMVGDIRTFDGIEYRSLMNGNPYRPPHAWELVNETVGVRQWAQPTGAQDAYAVGDRVMFGGAVWESTTPANVWQPGVFGWIEVTDAV